ncbi:MAG: SDR family NAD(P)-dependent oxidoreductase [Methylobacterium sp.]|jgi:3-oxoacyl-[acyl-carrier protein] reductase|uniref:SDR family NAD(P)-dependent oxidoreductase n=1 Tax=Pseudomonadota TaxID=1224 RepID=UPI00258F4C3B|nr:MULTISPECIES: SDR family oxidoreductase [Pseudomonadota]MCA3644616.1 SDR family oxidoreductase [Methylobacterium sp.]MCA3840884.1 SDR family oxidoreductase [Burkholderia sp.]MCA6244309.1 SDR family oxidoreductase [Phenylobacterium sp.]MCA6294441.1 SDR family oxidoreductase [Phenylobacterium sp.]
MLLKDKTAVVFAANGAIGSAVARRFSAEGAVVHISGRNADSVKRLGDEIGSSAETVDATDEVQVQAYFTRLANAKSTPNIVFNAIGSRAAAASYGRPAGMLTRDTFLLPLEVVAWSQFLTARSAANALMAQRQSGAIVTLSASLSGQFIPFMSGITAACGAVEAVTRTLAAEYGRAGIRVNCVRAGGMPETRTIRETTAQMAETMGATPGGAGKPTVTNVLGRPLQVGETATIVAFIASDFASGVAGQVVNVCAGALV